jgi:hypothetical protein
MENADSGGLRRLLRFGSERGNERAEGQRDDNREQPPHHLARCINNCPSSKWLLGIVAAVTNLRLSQYFYHKPRITGQDTPPH